MINIQGQSSQIHEDDDEEGESRPDLDGLMAEALAGLGLTK
jgi:hypothetical protein